MRDTKVPNIDRLSRDGDLAGLIRAFGYPSLSVQAKAVAALSSFGEPAIPGLLSAVRGGDAQITNLAALAISKIGGSSAVAGLLGLLDDEHAWHAHLVAIKTLGSIGDVRAVRSLTKCVAEKPEERANLAIAALQQIGSQAIPHLVMALRDEDPLIRGGAALALGEFADPEVVPELIPLLYDEEPWFVGDRAATALGALGDVSAVPYLLDILRLDDPVLQRSAARALGLIAHESAVAGLSAALSDRDEYVRIEAARALGRIGDVRALPSLLKLLKDEDESVTQAATASACAIAEMTSVPDLHSALQQNAQLIRWAAARGAIAQAVPELLEIFRELSPKDFREIATIALAKTSSEALRQLKDKILQALDEEEREQSSKADDSVCFTVIHPKEVHAEHSYTLLVYAHLSAVTDLIEVDARRFSHGTTEKTGTAREGKAQLKRGTVIQLVPEGRDFVFDPPSLTLVWNGDYERAAFRIRADTQSLGNTCFGQMFVRIGPLEVATIRFSIDVRANGHAAKSIRTTKAYSKMYRRIFASYSHRDSTVVRACMRAYEAIGDEVFIDFKSLRSGEAWAQGLEYMIAQSDVFQLFWSSNASVSNDVEREWRCALKCAKFKFGRRQVGEGFIRPLYWEQSMPKPPHELAHLHFKYMPEFA